MTLYDYPNCRKLYLTMDDQNIWSVWVKVGCTAGEVIKMIAESHPELQKELKTADAKRYVKHKLKECHERQS